MRDRVRGLVAPALLTVLVIFQIGYSYGEPSHFIFMPWILQRMDPSLLANDWFVNTVPHHLNSIRFMAWIARFMPLPMAVLVLHVLALFLLLWVAQRISNLLFGDGRVIYVAMFLFLRWGTAGLGGNGLWGNYLVQHNATVPVCLLAFYLALKNKPVAAAVACAGATWMHIQLGALTMLVVGVGMLVDWRRSGLRRIVVAGAVYLAAVAPTVVQQWMLYMAGPSPLSAAEYVYIQGVMRHPHHLIPSSWWGSDFYAFFFLVGIGALAADWRQQPHRTVLAWFVAILALCVAGTVFVEMVPVKLITKLQTFRMTVFVKFFAVLYAVRFLITVLEAPGRLKKICALAILTARSFPVIGMCAAVIFALRQKRRWLWGLGLFAAGTVAGVTMATSATRDLPLSWRHFGVSPHELGMGVALTAALGAMIWRNARLLPAALLSLFLFLQAGTWGPYFGYDHPPADEWYRFCRQVRSQTPPDAVFITPPFLGGFQLFAERAEVANFKCVPLIEKDLVEWKRRLEDLSGSADLRCSGWVDCGSRLAGGYFRLADKDFLALARKYGAPYVVTSQPGHHPQFPELFRLGDFVLYRAPVS